VKSKGLTDCRYARFMTAMRKIVRRIVMKPNPAAPQPAAEPAPPRDWTDEPLPLPKGKRLISLRLDADIVEYFQGGGRGYQTRMNAVLRAWMEARKKRHS
jgi:uncharacterized protein (DUF4415 family)